jgi:hypothetical protein
MYIVNVLSSMEEDTKLFEILLCSYSSRLHAVNNANGHHTDYGLYSLNNEKINYFVTHLIRTSFDKLIFSCLILIKVITFENFIRESSSKSYYLTSLNPVFQGLSSGIKFIIPPI